MRVFFIDSFGDALDLQLRAKACGHEVRVLLDMNNKHWADVGKGLVERTSDIKTGLRWADFVVLCGNENHMPVIEAFRKESKTPVFGPNIEGASWEIDRKVGMDVFKKHGIDTPRTHLCRTYEQAVAYVKLRDTRLVCKPCADTDKALSYGSKGPEDMLFMLDKWRKEGKIKNEFILQDYVDGVEFAVAGYMGKYGFTTGWLENFEHKKLMPGE